jgi:hypothetical protein
MPYQRIDVASGDPLGGPGALPRELRGLTGDVLADLTGRFGGRYDGLGYVRVAEPVAAAPRWLHKAVFKQLMTAPERIAIRAAAEADPVIFDFLDLLNSADLVDLDNANLVAGLGYLVSLELLAPNRPDELRGLAA